jgi:hypothetical protein
MSADFLLYDPKGKLVAAVGVKARSHMSEQWATDIVGDFLRTSEPPYLALVTRDQTYFWQDPARNPVPIGAVPTAVLLKDFLRDYRPLAEIDPSALEAAVLIWLWDATYKALEVPDLLRAIGFMDAIRNGDVQMTSAA